MNNAAPLAIDTYKKILEHSKDEIFVTDSEGYTIYCNPAFEKNYNVNRQNIIGTKFWMSEYADFYGISPIPNVIEDHQTHQAVHKTMHGTKLVVTAIPVFDDTGKLEMIVENVRDITELEAIKSDLDTTLSVVEKYKREVQAYRNKQLQEVDHVIGFSPSMQKIMRLSQRIAPVNSIVLIQGESGTGKSMFAKLIHRSSARSKEPFISVNCATIPQELLESELFGYAPGAFSGANPSGKTGLIELADGGTLFLDEVGELPLNQQVKLLELIQERRIKQVGSNTYKTVDIRIISATNQNLEKLVQNKLFREDLYYRLKVVEIEIPPLRDRSSDIPMLCEHYLKQYDSKYKFSHRISLDALTYLKAYSWPGNVRELQHIIEQLVVTTESECIEANHLPGFMLNQTASEASIKSNKLLTPLNKENTTLQQAIEETEKNILSEAFLRLGSSYKVAKELGLSQSTCNRKLRKYGIEKPVHI